MKSLAACAVGTIAEDLALLTELLGESYTSSYKTSSLKVRRRYRKLLVALEAERGRREHTPAFAVETRPAVRSNR